MTSWRSLLGTLRRRKRSAEQQSNTSIDGLETERLLATRRAEAKLREYAAEREAQRTKVCSQCGAAMSARAYTRESELCLRCTLGKYGNLGQAIGSSVPSASSTEERDVVAEYGRVLEDSRTHLKPRSSLPAPESEIKLALLAEASVYSSGEDDDRAYVDVLRECYSQLAYFVDDELAAKAKRIFQLLTDPFDEFIDPRELRPYEVQEMMERLATSGRLEGILGEHGSERLRLLAEFDSLLANMLAIVRK